MEPKKFSFLCTFKTDCTTSIIFFLTVWIRRRRTSDVRYMYMYYAGSASLPLDTSPQPVLEVLLMLKYVLIPSPLLSQYFYSQFLPSHPTYTSHLSFFLTVNLSFFFYPIIQFSRDHFLPPCHLQYRAQILNPLMGSKSQLYEVGLKSTQPWGCPSSIKYIF